MYGFVNHALELLVIRNYGPEVWEDIKKEAQLDEEGQFLVRIIYDDSKTYDLVAAASKVLNLNAGEILQMFGKMFFVFCQESGYDTILRVLGSNVREFLQAYINFSLKFHAQSEAVLWIHGLPAP